MEEYSDCCGASRHHIYNELCADCLEHFVECEDDYEQEESDSGND